MDSLDYFTQRAEELIASRPHSATFTFVTAYASLLLLTATAFAAVGVSMLSA